MTLNQTYKLASFSLIDQEPAREYWQNVLKLCWEQPYNLSVVRYAALWANLVEQRMACDGTKFEDVVESTSRVADVEGITGFMYNAAVAILSKVWVHGETLRRWHNHKNQINDEGDRANETGGVINTVVIHIGKPDSDDC